MGDEDNDDDEDDDDEDDGLGNNFGEIGEPSSQRAPVAGEPVRKISVTVCFVLLENDLVDTLQLKPNAFNSSVAS